jgi:hypothetical protein
MVTPITESIPQEPPWPSLPSSNLECVFQITPSSDSPSHSHLENWQEIGIQYVHSGVHEIRHQLQLPIRNLTDLFFANFMENVYSKTEQTQVFIEVQGRYFGVPGDQLDHLAIHASKDVSEFGRVGFTADDIRPLQQRAGELVALGQSRLLATIFSQPLPDDLAHPAPHPPLDPFDGHLENIDARVFAELNLAAISVGESRIIGDRNWVNEHGEACHLGIRRREDDTYVFATVTVGEENDEPLQGWMAFSPMG